eukprot:s276_g11.t1
MSRRAVALPDPAEEVTKNEGEEALDPKVLEDCELMVEANDHFLHNVDLQKVEEEQAEEARLGGLTRESVHLQCWRMESPDEVGRGHHFELRRPLAKPTARKCAGCGEDVLQHARGEVADEDFMSAAWRTGDHWGCRTKRNSWDFKQKLGYW